MSGLISQLPFVFEGISSRSFVILMLGGSALLAACLYGGISDANRSQERYNRALTLWLAQCGKPIEACAYDWDNSYTLRSIYAKRSGASS